MPSYLGSSAAFVGVVIAATGFNGQGINPNLSVARRHYRLWAGLHPDRSGGDESRHALDRADDAPVVTGAVVMAIGLNLAPIAVKSVSGSPFESWMAVITVLCIGVVAVFTRGMINGC